MFGNPQDIIAILAGAALLFGAGGAAVRNAVKKPPDAPAESAPEEDAAASETGSRRP